MTPTSARSLSSRRSHRSWPGRPRSARRGQVPEVLAGVAVGDDGTEGDLEDEIITARAVTVRALTVPAALGVVVALVVIVEERRQRGIGLEPDAPAVAAVTAVGATARDVFLAAEADAAGAPIAALDENVDLVDEHTHPRGPGGGPPVVTRARWRRSRSVSLRAARTARSRPPLRTACRPSPAPRWGPA